jgi:type IV pilus biogenesis protein CpaD/CtpE
MKIHAFRVHQAGPISLHQVLEHIHALPLEERLIEISGVPLRVEESILGQDSWAVDFAAIRHEGPGRAAIDAPIEDFDLQEEGFGHETAFYFDTATQFATLQYNHYGPRIARIQNYLYAFARRIAGDGLDITQYGFGFTPVLKADAAERLNHMGIVKNIEISFHVPGVMAQPDGERQSLNSFLNNPLVGSADRIRIQLSAGRARATSLAVNHVRQIVTDLMGARDDVDALNITAQETEDSPKEPVDFIEARLEADIPVAKVGRRFGRDERLSALRQAYDTWNANEYFR